MRNLILATSAALVVAGAASADVVVSLGSHSLVGGEEMTVDSGVVTGALTGVSISFDFVSGGSDAWASDLALVVNGTQFGGYDVLFGTTFGGVWGFNGPGSANNGHYSDTKALAGSAEEYPVTIGNGWSQAPASQYNNVVVTLHGVEAVPAPGAIALLGLAGVAARRRRA